MLPVFHAIQTTILPHSLAVLAGSVEKFLSLNISAF